AIASCPLVYTASILQRSVDAAHATRALWRQTQETEITDHEPSASHVVADPASWQLPEIIVGGQLRDLVARALETLQLAETEQPTVFVQSARLVQVVRDEKQRPLI